MLELIEIERRLTELEEGRMASYQARLDRIEAGIPAGQPEPILLFVRPGDSEEQVTTAYAEAHCLDAATVRSRACYVVFVRP